MSEDSEKDSDIEYDLSLELLQEMDTSRFSLEGATPYLFSEQFRTDPCSCHVG